MIRFSTTCVASPPLLIREFWPSVPLLLFQYADLFLQVFDHVLLAGSSSPPATPE